MHFTVWYVPEWFPGTAWKQVGKKQNQTIHRMIRGGHGRVRKAEVLIAVDLSQSALAKTYPIS